MRHRLGLLYGILIVFVLSMGIWWVYFLSLEGQKQAEYHKQKLANDQIHVAFLMQTEKQVSLDPDRWLGESFPNLVFVKTANGFTTEIKPEVLEKIEDDARASRNMFLAEGVFFLLLLGGGSAILIYARRSEMRYKKARELFLAGATHEFKTPLASLRLYTETLSREGLAEDDRQRIRSTMLVDIDRLENLVNDTLFLSADDTFSSGPPVVMDLENECQEVVADVTRFANDLGASIRFSGSSGLSFSGQRLAFNLALKNLIINALKHSPQPVSVTLDLEQRGKHHLIKVIDTGPGIPKRLHEKVFECFYSHNTGNRNTEGAGLGLYLVKRNVENMGGTITLESREGEGCNFTIKLPAYTKEHTGDIS